MIRTPIKTFASTLALTMAAGTGTAIAQDAETPGEPNPYEMPDDAFVTLTGTVTEASADGFVLAYDDGAVVVEMDDWDSWGDAWGIAEGQSVSVTGAIDDDLLETTTIEAASVYVAELNTNFYASPADEESLRTWRPYEASTMEGMATFNGVITDVKADEGEFTLDTGLYNFDVETDAMDYDPLDDEGFQKLRIGDVVTVTGELTDPLFEDRELVADYIITSAS